MVKTVKQSVFDELKSRRWISSSDLRNTYGESGLRRLREFRKDYDIKMRKTENGFEYRMVGKRN